MYSEVMDKSLWAYLGLEGWSIAGVLEGFLVSAGGIRGHRVKPGITAQGTIASFVPTGLSARKTPEETS